MIDLASSFKPAIGVVDLFCGIGGLSYGLQKAGLIIRAGTDIEGACAYPYEQNLKAVFHQRDITTLTGEEVNSWYQPNDIRVLAGCAPCQTFSNYAHKRGMTARKEDPKWNLLAEFGRLIEEIRPDVVTLENVPGLCGTDVWEDFLKILQKVGYGKAAFKVIRCQDIGLPQSRRRLVLIAFLEKDVEFSLKKLEKAATVRDAIGNGKLPPLKDGEVCKTDPLHKAAKLSVINKKRIKASKQGGSWRDWPEELRASCHRKDTGKSYPSVYGRMEWDKPSPTMTTQCYGFGNGRFGHPEQDRAITLREAAILQSFPQDYVFAPPNKEIPVSAMGMAIGNAVPPLLGEWVGRNIKNNVYSMNWKREHGI